MPTKPTAKPVQTRSKPDQPQRAAKKQTVTAKISSGKLRGKSVNVLLDTDDVVKEQVGGFVKFLREHAIVGLAVGFVVGAQSQAVVKQLITSFIDPAFKLFFGGTELSKRTFHQKLWGNSADFGWGGMVYALLNLLFVLAVIYALIKILKLDKLDIPKEKAIKDTAAVDTKGKKPKAKQVKK